MLKLSVATLSLVSYMVLSFNLVFAAPFALTKIGSLDLGGNTYPEWWYTVANPTFSGTAEENSEVTITVGDDSYKTNSDGSGNWSYNSSLANGDYDIKISQGLNSYSFKLHLGQGLPSSMGGTESSQSTESTSSVPATGYNQIAGIGFGVGLALLASYFYISGDVDRKSLFEKRLINEDR
jgi:hypothetical protein